MYSLCCSVPTASTVITPHRDQCFSYCISPPRTLLPNEVYLLKYYFYLIIILLENLPWFTQSSPQLPSGTRSCPNHYFTCAFPDLIISKQKHLSSSLLLLALCFGLKCPLFCPFLYLNITTLSKLSCNIVFPQTPSLTSWSTLLIPSLTYCIC